jgi:hypothetical protein
MRLLKLEQAAEALRKAEHARELDISDLKVQLDVAQTAAQAQAHLHEAAAAEWRSK